MVNQTPHRETSCNPPSFGMAPHLLTDPFTLYRPLDNMSRSGPLPMGYSATPFKGDSRPVLSTREALWNTTVYSNSCK